MSNLIEDEKLFQNDISMRLVIELLNSNISGYSIESDLGISRSNISAPRSGKRKIKNLNVKTAYKLSEYAKSIGFK
ncbi:MAG: hypothetical protein J6584_08970 [Lactobacillus sp.]|nr:hypothetical protein [Lactobacillus sp.]